MTDHQQHQIEVINQIEDQVKSSSTQFSTVAPVQDFKSDPRITLTSVHFPADQLKDFIQETIINPLKEITPELYYYPNEALHLTIKNVRVINDPPLFNEQEVEKAKQVFSAVVPKHKKIEVYFYRLLLFPNNIALIGTTSPDLDDIVLDLDASLTAAGVPDDKKYVNSKYFFCNMTLARFGQTPTQEFVDKVNELSDNINIPVYTIDSVTLGTGNAVMNNFQTIDKWELV